MKIKKIYNQNRIDYSTRLNCILSKKDKLRDLISLKKFPVFIGCTDKPKYEDMFFDMDWSVGVSSGLIQLKHLMNPKIIYSSFHSEAVGLLWKKHNEEFSKFVIKYCDSKVLEIGGGANVIANLCAKNKKIKNWYNFELAKINMNKIEYSKKVKYINKSVTSDYAKKIIKNETTLVSSHVLEHLYSPIETLKTVIENTNTKKIIFSIPNLHAYLNNKYVNVINFEHTYLLTEEILKKILSEVNFKIKFKKNFKKHSIFVYAVKSEEQIKYNLPNLNKYPKIYKKNIIFYQKKITEFNKIFLKKNKKVNFIFGAHIFSQYLLKMGLKENNFSYVLDNSKNKLKKRLYGTNLTVEHPYFIKKIDKPIVLVNVGQYQLEVEKQLKKINKKTKIVRI
jgi:hypothetical protein